MMNIRDIFQKHLKNCTDAKLLNISTVITHSLQTTFCAVFAIVVSVCLKSGPPIVPFNKSHFSFIQS